MFLAQWLSIVQAPGTAQNARCGFFSVGLPPGPWDSRMSGIASGVGSFVSVTEGLGCSTWTPFLQV